MTFLKAGGVLAAGIVWTAIVLICLWMAFVFLLMPFGSAPKGGASILPLAALSVATLAVWLSPLVYFLMKRRKGR